MRVTFFRDDISIKKSDFTGSLSLETTSLLINEEFFHITNVINQTELQQHAKTKQYGTP